MRRTLILLAFCLLLALLLNFCGEDNCGLLKGYAPLQDLYADYAVAPGESVVINVVIQDDSSACTEADSLVGVWWYQGSKYWKRELLTKIVDPGGQDTLQAQWGAFSKADSADPSGRPLQGLYSVEVYAYNACGKGLITTMTYRVSDVARETGPIRVTITTTHTGGTPVIDADVWATDMNGFVVIAGGQTNSEGQWTFWRPEASQIPPGDSILVWMSHPYVNFVVPETVVVQNVAVDSTFDGVDHTPTIFPDPDLQWVFGYLKWPGSDAGTMIPRIGVTITAQLVRGKAPYVPSSTLSRYVFTTETDSTGRWNLWVVPNEDITPPNTKYEFRIEDDDVEIVKVVEVPDEDGAIDFNDLR